MGNEEPCNPGNVTTDIEIVQVTTPPRPVSPRSPDSVAVVVTPPNYPFVETELLAAQQHTAHCGDREDVITEMRRVAADQGCDFVLIYGGNDLTRMRGYGHGAYSVTYYGYHAACGVYYGSGKPSAAAAVTTR